jgi:hypothetical protein
MSDRRRTVEPAEPEPRRHVEIVMGHVVLIDDVCQCSSPLHCERDECWRWRPSKP